MVPSSLRKWFVVHFAVDLIFAVPMFIAPVSALTRLGWSDPDPLTTRLVAAALMGIGIESLLGRNASIDAFRAMLNLKLIWSLAAIGGIALSMASGGPVVGWGIMALFAAFFVLWAHYRRELG